MCKITNLSLSIRSNSAVGFSIEQTETESKEVRNKNVKEHKSGVRYKAVSKALNMELSVLFYKSLRNMDLQPMCPPKLEWGIYGRVTKMKTLSVKNFAKRHLKKPHICERRSDKTKVELLCNEEAGNSSSLQ